MAADGEIAPRLGGAFHTRAKILIKHLGYIEKLNRMHGIDFGADIPSKRGKLNRPLFSPNGKTAFDFKAGIRVNIATEAAALRGKIDRLNNEHNATFSNITGGVLVLDNKIGLPEIEQCVGSNIYCWDIRYLVLLAKKYEIVSSVSTLKNLKERSLNEWTSYFLVPQIMGNFIQVKSFLFYQNPIQQLSFERLEELFEAFSRTLRSYTNLGLPIIVHFKLHSIAEIAEGGEEHLKELMHDGDGITYETQECYALDYHLAPWFVYCKA